MKAIYLHRTQSVGVEAVHIKGIAMAMKRAGHKVLLVGPRGVEKAKTMNGGKLQISSRFAAHAPEILFEMAEIIYDFAMFYKLSNIIRKYKPDYIYERYAFFAHSGSRCAKKYGISHIVEVNYTTRDPLFRKRSALLMPFAKMVEKKIFRKATGICVVSSKLLNRVIKEGVNPKRVTITPNAVDQDIIDDLMQVQPKQLNKDMAQKIVIGFVGGFYPWHGLDFLIDGVKILQEKGLPISLALVGDGPHRKNIQSAVRNAKISAIMPGSISYQELISWIFAMDICVLPHSNDYGSPMKLFEYMACGKPVLAPALPPLRDVITSGVNGILFSPESLGSFVECLELLIKSRTMRKMLGENAKEIIIKQHTWDHNLQKVFSLAGLKK